MTATPTRTLGELELLRLQVRATHGVVRRNIAGISHEESLLQPRPAGNCLNWVLGHLLTAYEGALRVLGEQPVMPDGALRRYARGAPPLTDRSDAIEFGELIKAWDRASERVEAGLGRLTSEVLDRPAPFSPTNNPKETVRSLLTTTCFHQAYHAGQTGLLRRLVGKEGAIA